MPEWAGWVPDTTVEVYREQYMPEMPPLESGAYLISILFELGPVMSGSMGAGALTFGEIDSWCNRVGIDLLPWESRFMHRLSREYVSESSRAEKRDCAAPWLATDAKPEVTSTQSALRALASL